MDFKKDANSLYNLRPNYILSSKQYNPTTVYSMQDDRGRLILRIDNASPSDGGIYKCHGEANSNEAYLSVHPPEHFAINRSSGLPAVPLAAGMIKFFRMFPSDRANEVILRCPLTPVQRVLAWEWREPIPPDSELAAVLPNDAIPSRTVSYNETGIFSNDNVEIGPNLEWVRILDPFSPEAPNKLWCKFEMQDLWHGKRGHPSYYEIHWTLYEPINVKVKLHNSSSEPLLYDENSRNGVYANQDDNKDDDYSALGLERERSSHRDRMAILAEPQPRLIEGYPARLACIYRPIHNPQTVGRPVQIAAWFRGEDYKSIPQPPFHVNNTQEEGVSWLAVRAFPVEEKIGEKSLHELAAQVPYEKITCVVNSLIDEENNFTVNSNGRRCLLKVHSVSSSVKSLMCLKCNKVMELNPQDIFNRNLKQMQSQNKVLEEFHSASNLASKIIILDKNGQPRSEKTVDGDEEEIQEALLQAEDQLSQSELLRSQGESERNQLSIIPLTNLLPGTNYTFEWSSANQFHLTTTLQFVTATTPLTAPNKPTHFIFLVPTTSHLRISVFLDDPCPYDNGGRAELSNILIRYRKAAHQLGQASYSSQSKKLLGYGNWSKTLVCLQNQAKDPADLRQSQQQSSIKWSGDAEIQCDVQVEDPQADLEVAVATMNRFGVSPWVTSIYRASDASTSAYFQTSSTIHPVLSLLTICFMLHLRFFM
ncbi:hypothetical protein Aperf_G00000120078 [Anoplocephala perfoliata]